MCSPGALSYRVGRRFKDNDNALPGPGQYSPGLNMHSSHEKLKGGKWGRDGKKDMAIRSSLGKFYSIRHIYLWFYKTMELIECIENPGPGSYKIQRDFGNY